MVDTNYKPIAKFGKYGNEDSGGPSARVKKPDIVNRPVVRVKLAYAAEAVCAAP